MDFPLSVPVMDQFFVDIDEPIRCFECALFYWECICTFSQSQSSLSYLSALSSQSSFHDPPSTDDFSETDLNQVVDYINGSGEQFIDGFVQHMNHNETTVQPATVQAHIDDTYLPGDRQLPPSPAESQCLPHRRHAPRKNGFACTAEGCNKAFDRNCELNRHLKIHLGRNERPHRCKVCAEGFLYPKDLIRHQRKHVKQPSAKTIFHCQVYGCNNAEGFSRRDNLLRHHRRQHEGVASPPA